MSERSFVYPFDVNSYLARKNPVALARAFRLAFQAKDKGVALLLRVNGDPRNYPGWQEVATEVSSDPRITVLPGTFERGGSLAYYCRMRLLVSPHRAEGLAGIFRRQYFLAYRHELKRYSFTHLQKVHAS